MTDSQKRRLFGKDGQPLIEPDPESLIEMSEVLSALRLSPAGNRVFVADCCRSSPNRPRGRAFGAKLKLADVPEQTAILFACSANEQAFEHKDWGHGAFTKCLLEELDMAAQTGTATMGRVADGLKPKVVALVKSQSNNRDLQTPRSLITDTVDLQLSIRRPTEPTREFTSKEFVSKSTGMKLALIPAGTFQMGSSAADVAAALKADSTLKERHLKAEQPQHTVRLSQPFYMGVYEVTQGEYESVMGTNPSHFKTVSGQNTSRFPVETVSWFDAVEFCNKLSARDGLPAHYTLTNVERTDGSIKSATVSVANPASVSRAASAHGLFGYRLPTEAEWEYACRANTTTPFHFGSTLNGDKANVDGNYPYGRTTKGTDLERTTTVGSYPKNAFGLFDMHGNVWEWCEDVYDVQAYSKRSGTTTDPRVTSGSEYRVLRGGSWNNYSWSSRSAYRGRFAPDARFDGYGFRVVISSSAVRTA